MMHSKWSDSDRERFGDGDVLRAKRVPGKEKPAPTVDEWDDELELGAWDTDFDYDPYSGACDLENPESCESCT